MTSSWIGVRGLNRAEICIRLGLVDTQGSADLGRDLLAISDRRNGWIIISSVKFAAFSRKRLAKLSRGAEVVSVDFQPNVVVSGAEAWRDGRPVWSVSHQLWNGPYDLEVRGSRRWRSRRSTNANSESWTRLAA